MIDLDQFHRYIVRPVNSNLGMGGLAADQAVCGVCLAESGLVYLDQVEGHKDNKPGPAYGVGQMEKRTHDDIWENYLKWHLGRASAVRRLCIGAPSAEQMAGNLYYAAAMVRIHLYRSKFIMPPAGDYKAMAEGWKKYYNTSSGAGIETEAEKHFKFACTFIR